MAENQHLEQSPADPSVYQQEAESEQNQDWNLGTPMRDKGILRSVLSAASNTGSFMNFVKHPGTDFRSRQNYAMTFAVNDVVWGGRKAGI